MRNRKTATQGRTSRNIPPHFLQTINDLGFRLEKPIRLNSLPITITLGTARSHAIAFLVLAAALDVAGFAFAWSALQRPSLPPHFWPSLLVPVFGMLALLAGLHLLVHREVVRIGECGVTCEEHGLFLIHRWCEPRSAFTGIHCDDVPVVDDHHQPAAVSTVQLQHRDRTRSILLYATRDARKARTLWHQACQALAMTGSVG